MFDKFDSSRAIGTVAAAGSQYAMCHYLEPRKWYTIIGSVALSGAIGYVTSELAAAAMKKSDSAPAAK